MNHEPGLQSQPVTSQALKIKALQTRNWSNKILLPTKPLPGMPSPGSYFPLQICFPCFPCLLSLSKWISTLGKGMDFCCYPSSSLMGSQVPGLPALYEIRVTRSPLSLFSAIGHRHTMKIDYSTHFNCEAITVHQNGYCQ